VKTSWPECEYFSQSSLVFPPHFPIDFILAKPTIPLLLRNIVSHSSMSTSDSNIPRSSANTQCASVGQRSLMLLGLVKGQASLGSAIPNHSCYAGGEGDRPGEPMMTEYVSVEGRKSSGINFDYLLMMLSQSAPFRYRRTQAVRTRLILSPLHSFDCTKVNDSATTLETLMHLAVDTALSMTSQGRYSGYGPLSMTFDCAFGGGHYEAGERYAYRLPTRGPHGIPDTVCESCYDTFGSLAGKQHSLPTTYLTLTLTNHKPR